ILELHLCRTAVQAFFSQPRSLPQIAGKATYVQRCRCVNKYQGARFITSFAAQHGMNDGRIVFRLTATELIESTSLKTKIGWRDFKGADFVTSRLCHERPICDGHFVEAVCSVNNPCAFNPEKRESTRHG